MEIFITNTTTVTNTSKALRNEPRSVGMILNPAKYEPVVVVSSDRLHPSSWIHLQDPLFLLQGILTFHSPENTKNSSIRGQYVTWVINKFCFSYTVLSLARTDQIFFLSNQALFTHNVFRTVSVTNTVIKCVLFIVIRILEKKLVHHPFCPLFILSPLAQR